MSCGTPQANVCAECGTELPAEAKFCFGCGSSVGAPSAPSADATAVAEPPAAAPPTPVTDTTLERLSQYVPPELLRKLEAAQAGHEMLGERRVVTMLFCDVQGSTAAAGSMDPEEWAGIINGAFEHLIAPVYKYEGTLARLMGDAILAFFGAPIAHEDDPQRAVLAGLEILEAVKPFSEEIKAKWGIEISVRVGINTGLVVVGEVGSDLRVEYTALGDAINIAARMEQRYPPDHRRHPPAHRTLLRLRGHRRGRSQRQDRPYPVLSRPRHHRRTWPTSWHRRAGLTAGRTCRRDRTPTKRGNGTGRWPWTGCLDLTPLDGTSQ